MADSDFVTEAQMNALVTALGTQAEKSPIYVFHGATAGTSRPSFGGTVVWVGTVSPTNADTSKDFWIDTS